MGMVYRTTALPGIMTISLTKVSMKALRSVGSLSSPADASLGGGDQQDATVEDGLPQVDGGAGLAQDGAGAFGRRSRRDGTTNVIAMGLRAVPSGVSMPPSHDWH